VQYFETLPFSVFMQILLISKNLQMNTSHLINIVPLPTGQQEKTQNYY